jgi:hypothetical protein
VSKRRALQRHKTKPPCGVCRVCWVHLETKSKACGPQWKTCNLRYPSAGFSSRPLTDSLDFARDSLAHDWRDRPATAGDPFCVLAVALWLPTPSYRTLSEMIQKRRRSLLEIGDAMRFLCCLLLGWSVLLSGCGESKEDAAVAAIEELGGEVTFDEKNPGKPVIVNLLATEVTDAGLVHLKGLTGLQMLGLSGTKVTDAGLIQLKWLTGQESLNLSNTKVADAGLVHLKGLKSLHTVNLALTEVTDAVGAHSSWGSAQREAAA